MREYMNEINVNMVAQYGLQAAMPKASGDPSDPILKEVERRDDRWKKIHALERDIKFIQSRLALISDERETEVLHWLLEGKSMRWIGLHMGLSDKHRCFEICKIQKNTKYIIRTSVHPWEREQ